MRLFIDSAVAEDWRRARDRGWLFGATTNPLILRRAGMRAEPATYRTLAAEADALGLAEVHIQATGTTADALLDSSRNIAALGPSVVVKVPMTEPGLVAASRLIADGARVTLTAAYSAQQVVAACAMNAAYVAPYFGRLLDAGHDAEAIVDRMRRIRDASRAGTRLLIASIRTLDQLETLAASGQDTFTLLPDLADQIGRDPRSDEAANDFETARRQSIDGGR